MKCNIPALCFGTPFESVARHKLLDLGTGEELGSMGLVVGQRIAADCKVNGRLANARNVLQAIPVRRRIEMSVNAADIFESGTVDCGGVQQTAADYHEILSRTSGLPVSLALGNTGRLSTALRRTEAIINGLSRGLPLDIFDTSVGEQAGATVRLLPRTVGLGCNMPNNSPGVHVTWTACPALGIPVLIRPGSAEPFTPYRLIQSFIQAGFPAEVFGFYPCDHGAAARIPDLTGAAIVFGSDDTVKQWANNPMVQRHGSGFSKLFIGEDRIEDWPSLIEALAENVAANSGRSCFAVSRIVVPKYGKEIADALAKRLAQIVPLPRNHPDARLSAMAMPQVAKSVVETINAGLKNGARDASAPFRSGEILVVFEGRTHLQPTIVHCDSSAHPLANEEFLFPFAAVVESSNAQAFAEMGPTLSLAVYTNDPALKLKAIRCGARLVSINESTSKLDRCQPHEENLFELLYHRLSYVAA